MCTAVRAFRGAASCVSPWYRSVNQTLKFPWHPVAGFTMKALWLTAQRRQRNPLSLAREHLNGYHVFEIQKIPQRPNLRRASLRSKSITKLHTPRKVPGKVKVSHDPVPSVGLTALVLNPPQHQLCVFASPGECASQACHASGMYVCRVNTTSVTGASR